MGRQETARVWHHAALPGVELFHGSYRTYSFARHYHAVPAIGVVEYGVMSAYCRGGNHLAPAGTVILLNPGDVHAPAPADGKRWAFRTFFLENSEFHKHLLLLGAQAMSFNKPFIQDGFVASSLLHLHRELEHRGVGVAFESALLTVVAHIAKWHVGLHLPEMSSRKEGQRIRRVKEYIDARYADDISLEALAEVAGFSPYHLLRSFRNQVGLTPHAYLIQTRVEMAKQLLVSGMSPAAVAARTGFVDQSHLHRNFKRIVGVTPGQYHPDLRKNMSKA